MYSPFPRLGTVAHIRRDFIMVGMAIITGTIMDGDVILTGLVQEVDAVNSSESISRQTKN